MHLFRRSALIGFGFGFVIAIGAIGFSPARADKLTEANMTQKDFSRLTKTESSVEGEAPTAPPDPVHNLDEEDEAAITSLQGNKVISGKDWKHETPEERDAHLRRIKRTMPANSHLVVSVPKGDVWLIPGAEVKGDDFPPDWKYQILALNGTLRSWTPAERAEMPVSVARDKLVSQSDKRGTTTERAVVERED